jgi:hypothetical protein
MFKKRVTDWKLNKNYKSAERKAVARVVEQYKNHGDPVPTILVHGQPVKMHRIQRHCKIGQLLTRPFRSAGYFDSSVLNSDAVQIRSGGLCMEYDEEMDLMGIVRRQEGNLPNMTSLFATPMRHLSPPDELKHVEVVLFQTKIFYEWYTQSIITQGMEGNGALDSEAEMMAPVKISPVAFISKISAALKMSQRRARWRLLSEAMETVKPMLVNKHPDSLRGLIRISSTWEELSPDLYRVIWRQISEMASIVLGDSDPLSKVCLAIIHITSKCHVFEAAARLLQPIFERNLGPQHVETLMVKSEYIASLIKNADFAGAERLQRTLISDFEKLGHEYTYHIVYQDYLLGYILQKKQDFSGAKKAFCGALQLSKAASEERFPTQIDVYIIIELVPGLAEDEYIDGEFLLREVLQKCLERKNWGRYDWRTVAVLGWLEYFLRKQEKFDEAEMIRLQYPEAF